MKQKLWPFALALVLVVCACFGVLAPKRRPAMPPAVASRAQPGAALPGQVSGKSVSPASAFFETEAQAAPKKATAPQAGAADNLAVSGQNYTIFQPDPKAPGKFLFKIYARGLRAQSVSNALTGTLTGVSAVLFQKGRATATLAAPTAQADSAQQVVTALGRVHVVSLVERGTTLDADTVVWHAKTNIVDATGHVVYRSGKNGATLRGPRYQANTALQTIVGVGAGAVSLR